MSHAKAIPSVQAEAASVDWLEQFALLAVFGVAATVQFSIAIAEGLLVVTAVFWLGLVISRRERIEAPRFFWWLLAYAAITLVSAAFSANPMVSFAGPGKQLALFLIVPIVYRLVTGSRSSTMVTLIVSVGAASAAVGIFQYGVLHYNIAYRPRGTLGHYMTFSGLLMLVIGVALARVLFGTRDRLWAALVMPALAVAVMLTFTRSASVGVCAAAAVLLSLKDFRLLAILPIAAAVLFAVAPDQISRRFVSTFDMKDPTVQDRVAMLREGEHMVRDHPLFGVGPNMVEAFYVEYRDPHAVEGVNPHLHNVPLQIAAERGIPALLIWFAFLGVVVHDVTTRLRDPRSRVVAAAAIAAVVAMLAAGLFEYNFGDSEFLMLFLILITLPFAAMRSSSEDAMATTHA